MIFVEIDRNQLFSEISNGSRKRLASAWRQIAYTRLFGECNRVGADRIGQIEPRFDTDHIRPVRAPQQQIGKAEKVDFRSRPFISAQRNAPRLQIGKDQRISVA